MPDVCSVSFDLSGFERYLALLARSAETSESLARHLAGLGEGVVEAFFRLEQRPAGRAGEIVLSLEPSDRLRELCPALGARDGDRAADS
jgi:hypothetical protein